ncbi:RNAse G [Caloramator quimbayensis]|uniref:RNAse G n=1 Tax=Caloramator quimbayensis TaxID=1147123 RepID=A0A1T4XYF2_9CLOT|nr:ribonuclease E/G [Caloramator quimbayensis]SKA94599.1 RNAse G [Caloramator quimbayensis]
MKEVYIDRGITQSRIAVFEDNKIKDLYVENYDNINITGNIYIGRVENIVPSLGAAFVNIGIGKNGILHIKEMENADKIKCNQEVIVQVIREDTKDKGPKLTQKISIPGKFMVLLVGSDYIGISKKIIENEDRKKLKEKAKRVYVDNYGFILRTEAQFVQEDDILKEYLFLISLWEKNINKAVYIKPPRLLFDVRDFFGFAIREYIKGDVEKIYVNRKNDVEMIQNMISQHLHKKCEVISDEKIFIKASAIEKQITEILERKKLLPSGGNIIVDKTEALTVIDVNSGSIKTKDCKKQYILNTNIEACKVISEAIRLGNISGIIIIDFIDMTDEQERQIIIETLTENLSNDKVKIKIYGFTQLGLLEMARAKKGKSLYELILKQNSINTYTTAYVLKLIENQCLKVLTHYKKSRIPIKINADILSEVKSRFSYFISDMKDIYGIEIHFNPSETTEYFEVIKKKVEE